MLEFHPALASITDETTGMSALHFAALYDSRKLAELLLDTVRFSQKNTDLQRQI